MANRAVSVAKFSWETAISPISSNRERAFSPGMARTATMPNSFQYLRSCDRPTAIKANPNAQKKGSRLRKMPEDALKGAAAQVLRKIPEQAVDTGEIALDKTFKDPKERLGAIAADFKNGKIPRNRYHELLHENFYENEYEVTNSQTFLTYVATKLDGQEF